jgi:pilus assembly protein TadC
MTLVVLAVVLAVLCWPSRPRPRSRLRTTSAVSAPRSEQAGVRRPVAVAAAVAVGALLIVGAPWWFVALLFLGAVIGARARSAEPASPDEVPVTADLMAACLYAGAGVADALAASLVAAGPWLRTRSEPVVGALRAGEVPEEAWRPWLGDARLAPIARTCMRTAGSGAAAAAELTRVAARLRAGQRAVRHQRVARASVWIVLPLGTCFLPAFVAVGVVPLVLSLVARLH